MTDSRTTKFTKTGPTAADYALAAHHLARDHGLGGGPVEAPSWPCGHPECAPLGDIKIEDGATREPTSCQLARMARYGMCPECSEKWTAWLDYKIIPPINIVQIGAVTSRSLEEGRQRWADELRDTVNFQQRLIRKICTIRHGYVGEEN
jgi:hypothetical protein